MIGENFPKSLRQEIAALLVVVLFVPLSALGDFTVPVGFTVSVFHPGLGSGVRHITTAGDGTVYAIKRESSGGGIFALQDSTGDGRADLVKRFGTFGGTGIGWEQGWLYASSDTDVYRFYLPKGQLIPSVPAEKIITGLPQNGGHSAKSIALGTGDDLYVNIGAPSNACQKHQRTPGSPGRNPCPELKTGGGIWKFNRNTGGQRQKQGIPYATGLRNSVALAWNPAVKKLYAVPHGRDQLHSLFPELYTQQESAELPAEEFHLVVQGTNAGWPYTYFDPIKNRRMVAPEYGGDGNRASLNNRTFQDPIVAFPGHWAPNGLLFYTGLAFPPKYRSGAFIAFHGSWNRAPLPQKGYKIAFVPFSGEQPSGRYEIFADGFAGTETVHSPGDAKFRPMGLATGPKGELFISDSRKGRVWKVKYTGHR